MGLRLDSHIKLRFSHSIKSIYDLQTLWKKVGYSDLIIGSIDFFFFFLYHYTIFTEKCKKKISLNPNIQHSFTMSASHKCFTVLLLQFGSEVYPKAELLCSLSWGSWILLCVSVCWCPRAAACFFEVCYLLIVWGLPLLLQKKSG